ncbi:MFS transporter [Anaerocolumna cellulosilytica]|uniref:MFS transporter n=1 Tax=Anaerocolumna cellulosilytica TaxID=433286 RepID=A0A6S6R432_9FIRM|nr:MFS transporter [Anaerocolumna cellulosilytica]MBB5195574.1 MFS family permease [Anaerocolumna cellulosilytica]BCJ93818.1 MFS transporter [Anaerocolumna cellulosilytica]
MNKERKGFGFKKFLLLWSGEFISAIGSGLTSFGLGVYVYQMTGKASAMALVTLFAFMPGMLLSAPAGVLADRYDRRILMVLGDSLSALGLLYILWCMLSGEAKLWQIMVGVTISSVFSSLLEPAYKATITDLLTDEEFTRASGLVQVAGAAKYLISPVLAGFLLTVTNIKLLLILDIGTFFVTVFSALAVKRGLKSKRTDNTASFLSEFKEGFRAISQEKGVLILIVFAYIITFFLGFVQTLCMPMILSFSSSGVLGVIETVSAAGMLVTSVIIGIFSIKLSYVKLLSLSIMGAGIFLVLFGLKENVILIGIAGFLFFSMLPFANTCLDYLIRINLDNEVQGRAWGLIGVISQMGYVFAYVLSGNLADYVFTPLLMEDGVLADSIGRITGTGAGRGIGLLISVSGFLLCLSAILLKQMKSIQSLEKKEDNYVSQINLE